MAASVSVQQPQPAGRNLFRPFPHSPSAVIPRAATGPAPLKEINLILETPEGGPDCAYETLHVQAGETVVQLRIRLIPAQKWLKLEQETQVLGDSSYLHVKVPLSHIESLDVSTSSNRNLVFSSQLEPLSQTMQHLPEPAKPVSRRSTLTAALQDDGDKSLVPSPSKALASTAQGPMVHLVVRKTAKLGWQQSNNHFELTISASDTAELLKQKIEVENGISAGSHTLLFNGTVLSSKQPLASYGIDSGAVLELVPVGPSSESSSGSFPDGSPLLSSPAHELFENYKAAKEGLASGRAPRLAPFSSGGSYFIADAQGNNVAVFKPEDEEPYALNNPRGISNSPDGQGLRKGVLVGEGAIREVAAFLLDHDHFSGVPPTALVSCQQHLPDAPVGAADAVEDVKIGSLQQFVVADGDAEERGRSGFPVKEVHKIAVLDIRLANTDRNGGNILVHTKGVEGVRLTPIDHGYCLPSSFEDISFEWLYWPQATAPFDTDTKAYIEALDAERDLGLLAAHSLFLRPECERVFRVCTLLLKKAAARGMTPAAIGAIMCREGPRRSPLEKLHSRALGLAKAAEHGRHFKLGHFTDCSDATYLKHMAAVLDEYLDDEVDSRPDNPAGCVLQAS